LGRLVVGCRAQQGLDFDGLEEADPAAVLTCGRGAVDHGHGICLGPAAPDGEAEQTMQEGQVVGNRLGGQRRELELHVRLDVVSSMRSSVRAPKCGTMWRLK
jgi:hypothetical protein